MLSNEYNIITHMRGSGSFDMIIYNLLHGEDQGGWFGAVRKTKHYYIVFEQPLRPTLMCPGRTEHMVPALKEEKKKYPFLLWLI